MTIETNIKAFTIAGVIIYMKITDMGNLQKNISLMQKNISLMQMGLN